MTRARIRWYMFPRALVFALVTILFLAASAAPSFGWKFVSMADSRGSDNGVNTAVLTQIVNLVNSENADLVIFQGDAVSGSSTDSVLSSQMDTWLSVMNNLNCPWYFSPGNHEIRTATSEAVLRTKVDQPLNGPPGHEEMVYSFDHQNAHFVSLNSNHYGEAHHVQRAWLSTDLAGTSQPHIFVMAHEPAYPVGPHVGSSLDVYPTERDDFWNIMSNAKVGMYFCGHEHLYSRSTHGSIYQIINGTCGAPIYSGPPGTIGEYHYVVVEIDGYNVYCEAKDNTGALLDSWSYAVGPPAQDIPISSIKGLPDGTMVAITNKTVTVGTDDLVNTLYIEDQDRSSGIKVYTSDAVAAGDGVTVAGELGTIQGERAITNPSVSVISPTYPIPKPISMLTREVGGASLNPYTPGVPGGISTHNLGMLVEVWGRVSYVNTLAKYFYIDDGCGLQDGSGNTGLLVHCGGRPVGNTITLPAQNAYVKVTSIGSCRPSASGIIPTLRPRTQSDVVVY